MNQRQTRHRDINSADLPKKFPVFGGETGSHSTASTAKFSLFTPLPGPSRAAVNNIGPRAAGLSLDERAMASEIEYKFLVAADTWKPESRGILIRQGIVR